MAELDLRSVRKTFGKVDVIHGVDLEAQHGEFVVFVGPSGCGKSTLLRMIAGLETVTSGEIRIDGEVVNDRPAARRGVAMVFQSYALYPHMSVRQNMSFGLENIGTKRPEIEKRIAEAARMLQIEPLLDRQPRQLSGGQRQRVAIGRAIVRDPKIFLFDEPLSNLDAELRVAMRAEISALHERLGNTMVYVTHDQIEAMTMADKIVVLRAGRVEQIGAPLELYNRPANQFVAGFIGSPRMNFVSGRIAAKGAGGIRVAVEGLPEAEAAVQGPDPVGAAVVLGIRPEHVERAEPGSPGAWTAEVSFTEQFGSSSYLHCVLPNGEPLNVFQTGQTSARRGDVLALRLPPACCHVFAGARDGAALPRLEGAA